MKKSIFSIIMSLAVVWGAGPAVQAGIIGPELNVVLQSLGPDEEVAVIVTLTDQVDLKNVKDKNKDKPKDELRTALITELKDKKDKTQKVIKDFLKDKKVKKVTSFWIFNGLAATAPVNVINELAGQTGVGSISLDGKVKAPQPAEATAGAPEWNIDAIQAPALWSLGYTGSGVVVASMDTGVDYNHNDLSTKWRGGSNSWFDPNGQHATPYDKSGDYSGHGTQVMSVIVGGDATGSFIGVAPASKWIAVKIFDDAGVADFSDIHAGFQWLLDPDGNPGTNDSPDVVNNSWGYAGSLVNQCFTEFRPDIQALKAAEIAVVFSGGNSGPNPSTSESPANYPESFAAGAVDQSMSIDSSSGRGTSACDDTIYPEVTAPGVSVKTADLTFGGAFPNAFAYATGTSIAAPHVSGSMALLAGAFPWATVSELESALKAAAVDLGDTGPENTYGFGLVNVMAAYNLLDQGAGTCTDADGDGFYAEADCGAVQDCNDNDPDIYPGAQEIKHDGIDQDCNDYDLTIDIIKAAYTAKKDTLSVEATSSLGKSANLELEGYGAMSWDRKKAKWKISARKVGGNPGSVTVSGIEGSETASVN